MPDNQSLTYGFYNSVIGEDGKHDRVYDAVDFAKIFSGIITDGIFPSVGELFRLKPAGGLNLAVGSGRAWFDDTWTHNDSDYILKFNVGHPTMQRVDAVVLTIDKGNRVNSLGIVPGTAENGGLKTSFTESEADSTARKMVVSGSSALKNYILGYVKFDPSHTTEIVATMVKQLPLPYATGILQVANLETSGLYGKWDADFHEWFTYIQNLLSENDVAVLTSKINSIHEDGVEKLMNPRAVDGLSFNGTTDISRYGICTTAASTAAKEVSIDNYVLKEGGYVIVKFTNSDTSNSDNLTLNVNGTGAKPIKYRGNTLPVQLMAGLYLFTYDGANYELISAGMENRLENYVPTTRRINNKELKSNITLYGSDIVMSSTWDKTLSTRIEEKVDKVSGKALSTNDFTNAYKTKLDGIAAGANNYTYTLPTASSSVLGGIKVGANLSISGGVLSGSPNTNRALSMGAEVKGSMSPPTGTWTTMLNVVLNSAFYYFVIADVEFAKNTAGTRGIRFQYANTVYEGTSVKVGPNPNGETQLQCFALLDGGSTMDVQAYQSSGGYLSATARYKAFAISKNPY